MAALLKFDSHWVSPTPVRRRAPLVLAHSATPPGVRPARPRLVMRWAVGPDSRLAAKWLPEPLAIVKSPDD
jgi:hypothetical protein